MQKYPEFPHTKIPINCSFNTPAKDILTHPKPPDYISNLSKKENKPSITNFLNAYNFNNDPINQQIILFFLHSHISKTEQNKTISLHQQKCITDHLLTTITEETPQKIKEALFGYQLNELLENNKYADLDKYINIYLSNHFDISDALNMRILSTKLVIYPKLEKSNDELYDLLTYALTPNFHIPPKNINVILSRILDFTIKSNIPNIPNELTENLIREFYKLENENNSIDAARIEQKKLLSELKNISYIAKLIENSPLIFNSSIFKNVKKEAVESHQAFQRKKNLFQQRFNLPQTLSVNLTDDTETLQTSLENLEIYELWLEVLSIEALQANMLSEIPSIIETYKSLDLNFEAKELSIAACFEKFKDKTLNDDLPQNKLSLEDITLIKSTLLENAEEILDKYGVHSADIDLIPDNPDFFPFKIKKLIQKVWKKTPASFYTRELAKKSLGNTIKMVENSNKEAKSLASNKNILERLSKLFNITIQTIERPAEWNISFDNFQQINNKFSPHLKNPFIIQELTFNIHDKFYKIANHNTPLPLKSVDLIKKMIEINGRTLETAEIDSIAAELITNAKVSQTLSEEDLDFISSIYSRFMLPFGGHTDAQKDDFWITFRSFTNSILAAIKVENMSEASKSFPFFDLDLDKKFKEINIAPKKSVILGGLAISPNLHSPNKVNSIVELLKQLSSIISDKDHIIALTNKAILNGLTATGIEYSEIIDSPKDHLKNNQTEDSTFLDVEKKYVEDYDARLIVIEKKSLQKYTNKNTIHITDQRDA